MTDSARKAVVRDLPPTLPAEVFWKAVEPWVRTEPETARTAKHTSYVQGKRAEQPGVWEYRQSVSIMRQLMGGRMFPMSLQGLESAMRLLSK